MKNFKTEQVETQVIESVKCDKCGVQYDFNDPKVDTIIPFAAYIEKPVENTSQQFYIEYELCQDCFMKMLEKVGIDYRMYTDPSEVMG